MELIVLLANMLILFYKQEMNTVDEALKRLVFELMPKSSFLIGPMELALSLVRYSLTGINRILAKISTKTDFNNSPLKLHFSLRIFFFVCDDEVFFYIFLLF